MFFLFFFKYLKCKQETQAAEKDAKEAAWNQEALATWLGVAPLHPFVTHRWMAQRSNSGFCDAHA